MCDCNDASIILWNTWLFNQGLSLVYHLLIFYESPGARKFISQSQSFWHETEKLPAELGIPIRIYFLTLTYFRAIFNWVSKVIRDCIGFALLRSVIGLENSRHPLNQSDAKLKPIATWSLAFSRAWDRLGVFTLIYHWFVVIFVFVLIGRCDYFGFGFSTLNWKLL